MDSNDLIIMAIVVLISFLVGGATFYFIASELTAETPVDDTPTCPEGSEVYTPGTCGVNSNMTFFQCKPIATTGGT